MQFWVNMKPYTNQPFGPKYIPYTIGVSEKNTFIDQKTSLHKLFPGYQTTIYVIPKLLETTSDFNNFDIDVRGCKLPHETSGFKFLREYSQKGCELECAIRKATSLCQCLPWQYPNNFSSFPMCDMFGGHCFNHIVSSIRYYKTCKTECLEDCHKKEAIKALLDLHKLQHTIQIIRFLNKSRNCFNQDSYLSVSAALV